MSAIWKVSQTVHSIGTPCTSSRGQVKQCGGCCSSTCMLSLVLQKPHAGNLLRIPEPAQLLKSGLLRQAAVGRRELPHAVRRSTASGDTDILSSSMGVSYA